MIDDILEEIEKVLNNSRSIEWKNKNSKKTVLKNIKKNISNIINQNKLALNDIDDQEEGLPTIKYGGSNVIKLHDKKEGFHRVMTSDESAKGDPKHAHE